MSFRPNAAQSILGATALWLVVFWMLLIFGLGLQDQVLIIGSFVWLVGIPAIVGTINVVVLYLQKIFKWAEK